MGEVLSLHEKLSEDWEKRKEAHEHGMAQAEYNLGRLALIYGGQMHFDFDAAEDGQSA